MKKIIQVILVSISLFFFKELKCLEPDVSLQELWEEESKYPNERYKNVLFGKHVIFVSGIMGAELADIFGNYFPDNIESVEKELGGTATHISPSSHLSIPENAFILKAQILEIYYRVRKPLKLFGHSKGGAELHYLILTNPELITDGIVEDVILVEAAIHGSPLADRSSGFLFGLVDLVFSPNMETLSTTVAKEYNKEIAKIFEEKIKVIANKKGTEALKVKDYISHHFFYVLSKTTKSKISFGVSLVQFALQDSIKDTDNDGLLTLDAQIDNNVGIALGILDVDHIGLVVSHVSNVSRKKRKAFTRLVFGLIQSLNEA